MTEYKFFDQHSHVSTFEFHKDRPRAPHLEQVAHRHRLLTAKEMVTEIPDWQNQSFSDLGCGDGGFLQLLKEAGVSRAWGFDFHPASEAGWAERGVRAYRKDWTRGCLIGSVVVLTEVLEHLEDPHGKLRELNDFSNYVIASSPMNEDSTWHADEHAWAWDWEGYQKLFTDAGFDIIGHIQSSWSQLILAKGSWPVEGDTTSRWFFQNGVTSR